MTDQNTVKTSLGGIKWEIEDIIKGEDRIAKEAERTIVGDLSAMLGNREKVLARVVAD